METSHCFLCDCSPVVDQSTTDIIPGVMTVPVLAGGFPLLDYSLAEHLHVWLLITQHYLERASVCHSNLKSHLAHLVVHSGSGQTVINLDNREEESVF